MVFNGALNGGDGRALLSRLRLAPPRPSDPGCYTPSSEDEPGAGSLDGDDVLERNSADLVTEDVPLVTAALLSARFPVVAPAARLGDHADEGERRCATPLPLPPVTVRDGGYIENTGLMTITDLLPTIRESIDHWRTRDRSRCGTHVQIVVVSIDDDPALLDDDPRLVRSGRSLTGIAKQAGPAYLSRLSRDRLTSCRFPDVIYVRISPPPHVGASAATGWEVSGTARRHDLGDALAEDRTTGRKVDLVRRVLTGEIQPVRCERLETAAARSANG